MSEDHDRCFSILVLGASSTGVFNTNASPRINIGVDVWGESSIHQEKVLHFNMHVTDVNMHVPVPNMGF
jgi:hypothetical protein